MSKNILQKTRERIKKVWSEGLENACLLCVDTFTSIGLMYSGVLPPEIAAVAGQGTAIQLQHTLKMIMDKKKIETPDEERAVEIAELLSKHHETILSDPNSDDIIYGLRHIIEAIMTQRSYIKVNMLKSLADSYLSSEEKDKFELERLMGVIDKISPDEYKKLQEIHSRAKQDDWFFRKYPNKSILYNSERQNVITRLSSHGLVYTLDTLHRSENMNNVGEMGKVWSRILMSDLGNDLIEYVDNIFVDPKTSQHS